MAMISIEAFCQSMNLDLTLSPAAFLQQLNEAANEKLQDDELAEILGCLRNTGEKIVAQESSTAKVKKIDGKEVNMFRKCNRNQKFESLNFGDVSAQVHNASKEFRDAAGLGSVSEPEKMNLEPNQPLPPLAFGSSNAVFFDFASDAIEAMRQQASMAAVLAQQLALNVKRAEELVKAQEELQKKENNERVPMTGALRALMNQNKMKLETFTVGAASWLSGMYLPKLTMCLMTAFVRPEARTKSQSLLQKLDVVLSKLKDDATELPANMLESLDFSYAEFVGQIQKAGCQSTMVKQLRGGFSVNQKREDHLHSKFVTASLREQLFFFIATAALQMGRRINRKQFALPRLLVAAERFVDTDVNGTVDAFREGNGSCLAFVPPDIELGPVALTQEQFDGGGSIGIMTVKTLRLEKTGSGVEETETALLSTDSQTNISEKLVAQAMTELQEAETIKTRLNVTDKSRTNEIRCNIREHATDRGKQFEAETVDFVRKDPWLFVTEKAAPNVERPLVETDAKISPLEDKHAPKLATLKPSVPLWMEKGKETTRKSKRMRKSLAWHDEGDGEEEESKKAQPKLTRDQRHINRLTRQGITAQTMTLKAPVGAIAIGAGAGPGEEETLEKAEEIADLNADFEADVHQQTQLNTVFNRAVMEELQKFATEKGEELNAGLLTAYAFHKNIKKTECVGSLRGLVDDEEE